MHVLAEAHATLGVTALHIKVPDTVPEPPHFLAEVLQGLLGDPPPPVNPLLQQEHPAALLPGAR